VRPLLVAAVAEMYGVDRDAAVRVGVAIEAVHVYSLIHDDLPCMDNDALRHGKPTVHKPWMRRPPFWRATRCMLCL
jgi:farnesyl diphosphate synthase